MFDKALDPTELVFEFRSRRRIPVGEIKTADLDVIDHRLDIPAVRVFRIAGQTPPSLNWSLAARKNRNAIPALLTMPDRSVSRVANRNLRKVLLRRFQFL